MQRKMAGFGAGSLILSCMLQALPTLGQVLVGQLTPGGGLTAPASSPNPLSDTTINPGKALLFDLEAKFAKATAEGGGQAFAQWFAEDAVTLANGEEPVHGRDAIARHATWQPKDYQLTWTPTEAVLSPTGDMGYTWGHYEGHSRDANGNPVVTTGRYMTIWRREPDGSWKVVMDASNTEPAGAADCCKLPPSQ